MNKKTGADLIRASITRFWYFNLYLQKPYDIGYNFMYIFKLAYLIEIFLTCFRPFRKNTYNKQIYYKLKKNTHRLIQPGTYKLTTFRLNQQHNKINLYVNITSRKEMFPKEVKLLVSKTIILFFKKKFKYLRNNKILFKKNIYTRFFGNQLKKGTKKLKNKTTFFSSLITKKNKLNKTIIQKLKKNRIKNYQARKKTNFSSLKKKLINIHATKNFKIIKQNKKNFKKIIFRFLKKQIIENKQKLRTYKKQYIWKTQQIKNQRKNIYFVFKHANSLNKKAKKNYNNNKWKIVKYHEILQKLKNKERKKNINNKKKTQKNKLWFNNFKKNIIVNKIQPYFNAIAINNNTKNYTKSKTNWKFNLKKTDNLENLTLFWYIQLYNQFLQFKAHKFLNFFVKLNYFNVLFKQEFAFPKITKNLNILEKNILKTTRFLKMNNKFYFNFVNIIPSMQTFVIAKNLANQIAAELGRTKKHWKVLQGIELLIIQTFIEIQKEPINAKSNFKGLQITIKGRPNKISRTKKIVYKFGIITKASFFKTNVTQSFASSNAQIGSFGVHVMIVT